MHGFAAPARARVLAVVGMLVGCGGVDPLGPSSATHTTLASDTDDDCAPATTAGDESAGDTGMCPTMMCTPGIEGCPCTRGGACDPGLSCISEVCVDTSCAVGTLGCPCTPGGGCDPELTCVEDVCTAP